MTSKTILSWICDGMKYWYLGCNSTTVSNHETMALLDEGEKMQSTRRDMSSPWWRWLVDMIWGQARKPSTRSKYFLGAQTAQLEIGAVLKQQAVHACLVHLCRTHVYLKHNSLARQSFNCQEVEALDMAFSWLGEHILTKHAWHSNHRVLLVLRLPNQLDVYIPSQKPNEAGAMFVAYRARKTNCDCARKHYSEASNIDVKNNIMTMLGHFWICVDEICQDTKPSQTQAWLRGEQVSSLLSTIDLYKPIHTGSIWESTARMGTT